MCFCLFVMCFNGESHVISDSVCLLRGHRSSVPKWLTLCMSYCFKRQEKQLFYLMFSFFPFFFFLCFLSIFPLLLDDISLKRSQWVFFFFLDKGHKRCNCTLCGQRHQSTRLCEDDTKWWWCRVDVCRGTPVYEQNTGFGCKHVWKCVYFSMFACACI